ncbi:MAG TPA: DUF2786 domain-containing protein [Verrucomicrobiae bacterium]|jgi:hypothetical protein|nr:DUF2786 domain-containing protein [Verrucomicrobiae bacterium]
MINESVLEKIKKLLRLAQSSNRHEAELAMQRAFELAARHNIDMADVDVDEQTKRILHKAFGIGARFSLIRKLTLSILENYFNVRIVLARPSWLFVGTETDVEIAIYVHGFLVSACSRCLRKYQDEFARKLSTTKRNSFIAGFMYGIFAKLHESRETLAIGETKTAVALRDKENRDKYIKDHIPTVKVPNFADIGRRNRDALMDGFRQGQDTEINKGLNGKPGERKLLTAGYEHA